MLGQHRSAETEDERTYSGQLQQSDRCGFSVAHPQGLLRGWNGYGCCSTIKAAEVDDVRFARAVIEGVEAPRRSTPAAST